jgi:hypothetical protein
MLREIEDKSILHGIASILRMSLGVFFDLFRAEGEGYVIILRHRTTGVEIEHSVLRRLALPKSKREKRA